MSWVKPALKIAGEVLPVAAVYAEKLFSEDSVPKFFSLDLKNDICGRCSGLTSLSWHN